MDRHDAASEGGVTHHQSAWTFASLVALLTFLMAATKALITPSMINLGTLVFWTGVLVVVAGTTHRVVKNRE